MNMYLSFNQLFESHFNENSLSCVFSSCNNLQQCYIFAYFAEHINVYFLGCCITVRALSEQWC